MSIMPVPRQEIMRGPVAQIGKRLEAIPPNMRGEVTSTPVPWFFTNDSGFASLLPRIETALSHQKLGKDPRIALLSGAGSFANMAPYFKADGIVCADVTDGIFSSIERSRSAIVSSFGPKSYIRTYDAPTYFKQMKDLGADPTPYWEIERTSFGDRHFLATDGNFERTKKALEKTPFFYSQGNFVHRPYVEALAAALSGSVLSYGSFTDLAEWYPDFLDLVALLPFANDSVIVWSTNQGQKEAHPVAQFSVGVENYIADARKALAGTNVSYHKQYLEPTE
jgi:hypothetical protein